MSFVTAFLTWLSTDQGLETVEFISWVLLGLGSFAIVLGKKRTEKLAAFLDSVRERLSAERIPHLAKRLTLGPLGLVALWLCGIACVAALVFDVVEVCRAIHMAYRELPTDGQGLAGFLVRVTQNDLGSKNPIGVPVWAMKASAATLTVPLFCFGAMVAIWLARRPAAARQYETWVERVSAAILKYQTEAALPNQILVALVGTVALAAFGIGMVAAWVALAILFMLLQTVLRAVSLFADRRRLQYGAAVAGALLKLLAFFITVFG